MIVEPVVELMKHAVGYADDDDIVSEFESKMLQFGVGEFADQCCAQRDLDPELYM